MVYNTSHGKWILHTGHDNQKPCRLIYRIGPEHSGKSWPLVVTPMGCFKYCDRRKNDHGEMSWVLYQGPGRPYGSEKRLHKWKAQKTAELIDIHTIPVHVIHHFFDAETGKVVLGGYK